MPTFQNAPLTRHEALAPFSRDHYAGLVQAQHLLKASQADAVERRQATAEFIDAWDREVAPHLQDEERWLLPVLSESQRHRLVSEHRELRDLAQLVREQRRQTMPSSTALEAMGSRLRDHIRWEERVLFQQLQQSLDDDELAELQRYSSKLEAQRPRNICRC